MELASDSSVEADLQLWHFMVGIPLAGREGIAKVIDLFVCTRALPFTSPTVLGSMLI